MNTVEAEILRAVKTNRLNPEILGKRKWHNYLLRVSELVWSTNLYDGYLIEVFNKDKKHLCSLKV